jgi:hypothetical protein
VADGHLVLQDGRQPLGGVQDAVVLHVAAGADHDRVRSRPAAPPRTRHSRRQQRSRRRPAPRSGEQNYSFDEMKAAGWHISLSLG